MSVAPMPRARWDAPFSLKATPSNCGPSTRWNMTQPCWSTTISPLGLGVAKGEILAKWGIPSIAPHDIGLVFYMWRYVVHDPATPCFNGYKSSELSSHRHFQNTTVWRRDERDDLRCGGQTRDPRGWPREGLGQDVLLRRPEAAGDAVGEGVAQPVPSRPHRPHRYVPCMAVARRPCRAHRPRPGWQVGGPHVA